MSIFWRFASIIWHRRQLFDASAFWRLASKIWHAASKFWHSVKILTLIVKILTSCNCDAVARWSRPKYSILIIYTSSILARVGVGVGVGRSSSRDACRLIIQVEDQKPIIAVGMRVTFTGKLTRWECGHRSCDHQLPRLGSGSLPAEIRERGIIQSGTVWAACKLNERSECGKLLK